jgi:hypothetical protein
MILEGIVTSIAADGALNIAPMGPQVEPAMEHFVLRPFRTSQTYLNLKVNGAGVLHVTDDVLLLAQAAIGRIVPEPPTFAATKVHGRVLQNCCRYYEFQVRELDEHEERVRIEAEVLLSGRLGDLFGFNRGKHAVVEAAILATRTAFLPLAEIETEYKKLAILIDKTGGEQERQAFELLRQHVERSGAAALRGDR